MLKRRIGAFALLGLFAVAAVTAKPHNPSRLTAEEIVAKNVAVRGGLEAWRQIQTVTWVGHIETGSVSTPLLPFVLEMKRPNKTRFEIMAEDQQSVRIFDGAAGWKTGKAAGARPGLQPYTPEELRSARDAQTMEGPLIDYAAKGVAVALEGMDQIEGHEAYRLNVTLPLRLDSPRLDRCAHIPRSQI